MFWSDLLTCSLFASSRADVWLSNEDLGVSSIGPYCEEGGRTPCPWAPSISCLPSPTLNAGGSSRLIPPRNVSSFAQALVEFAMSDVVTCDGSLAFGFRDLSGPGGSNGASTITSFGEIEVTGYGRPLEVRCTPTLTGFRLTIGKVGGRLSPRMSASRTCGCRMRI